MQDFYRIYVHYTARETLIGKKLPVYLVWNFCNWFVSTPLNSNFFGGYKITNTKVTTYSSKIRELNFTIFTIIVYIFFKDTTDAYQGNYEFKNLKNNINRNLINILTLQ